MDAMKASRITGYGGSEVTAVEEVPKPKAADGHVVVEVHAAGVNPFDAKLRAGNFKDSISLEFPATLGGDIAGVVAEVGTGVSGISVGDEVYGSANATGGAGSFAEYVAVSADQLAAKPGNVSFVEAGALPLAGASAYQVVVEHLDIAKGQRLLVHGGAGGIGSLAIQIAKHFGAQVITTVRASDRAFAKELGADEVIDYRSESFTDLVRDCDAVFDTAGGDVTKDSLKVIRPGGMLASMQLYGPLEGAEDYDVKVIPVHGKATAERLTALARLVDEGAVQPIVDRTFPLDQAGDALTYLQEGHPQGKVVVRVKGERLKK
ncbi:MAG: NADP-dependent oxidoreductase [bacterium]|nr:NADP-dependent oxidoreductase [bacterium]